MRLRPRRRWELRAVPGPSDDDGAVSPVQRALITIVNDSPDRFILRRSAERAALVYGQVIPGVSFYVMPIGAPPPALGKSSLG